MAHYALLDEDNIVTDVIVGYDENHNGIDWEQEYSTMFNTRCLRTSYNTFQGRHLSGGKPFRGNYAGLGSIYNEELDVFVPPKVYDSWVFDESVFDWVAPIPYPLDGKKYIWDEELQAWEPDFSRGDE